MVKYMIIYYSHLNHKRQKLFRKMMGAFFTGKINHALFVEMSLILLLSATLVRSYHFDNNSKKKRYVC